MGIFLQQDAWSSSVNEALPALVPLGLIVLYSDTDVISFADGIMHLDDKAPHTTDKYKPSDVTLIIPTIDTDEEAMHEAMRSWVLNEPKEILIVTVGEETQKELRRIADTSIACDITRVLRVEMPANKRIQLVHGINAATTPLVCFTDDDAIWNSNFLKWLVAPFNDPKMGGTGSNQIMRPNDLTSPPTVFERIADMRLSSRMLEAAASTFYDGSVSCLSGRTALYHKRILTDQFPQEFTGEKWRNKYPLISGDDKFMTRWIVKHGWKMSMQISPECTLATTFKADGKFFMQILRWTRNTWRSDIKSLVVERDIWYRYPIQAILMCDRMISPFTLMLGPVFFILSMALIRVFEDWTEIVTAVAIYFIWIMCSRTVRVLPHIYRCPEDITYMLYFIGYQYFFAALKLYALTTLHITAWGTREGVGTNDKKTKAQLAEEEEAAREEAAIEAQLRKEEVRVHIARKDRVANKTYKAGNVALMRRIHLATMDEEQEEEQQPVLERTPMPQYGSQYGGTAFPQSAVGSVYPQSYVGSVYPQSHVGSVYPQSVASVYHPSTYSAAGSQLG